MSLLVCAQEPEISNGIPTLEEKPQKPRPSFFLRFYKFIRIFLMLLSNEQLFNQAKTLKQLIVAIIQTATSLIKSGIIQLNMSEEQIRSALSQLDSETKDELCNLVTKRAIRFRQIPIISHRKPDEKTQFVLINFTKYY